MVPPESKIYKFRPFIDEDGILRIRGRIGRSAYSFEVKHPAILWSHHLTGIIIRNHHITYGHGTTERVLGELRTRYHVVGGRRAVKRVIMDCSPCERWKVVPVPPVMAPLSPERFTPKYPFLRVEPTSSAGTGSWSVDGERRGGMISTDLVCRAVNIEKNSSMSPDSFILAHRRFCAVRGVQAEE